MAQEHWRARTQFIILLAASLVLAGCPGGREPSDLSDLFISNRRFNIDDSRGLVRVYARLENTGQSRYREVEVHVTLLSASGDNVGENSVVLHDLKPGEKRDFAIGVTSHGRTHDVQLEVLPPQTP